MIFIDSDIIIDIWRNFEPSNYWIKTIDQEVLISGFSYMELLSGCENQKAIDKLKKALFTFSVIWPSTETSNQALETYSRIKLKSGIDFVDCLIGHTAIALNIPLYTFNEKHFKAISNLKIIKPYKKNISV
jgi:predicted nucleic acid-binding protein